MITFTPRDAAGHADGGVAVGGDREQRIRRLRPPRIV